MPLRSIRNPSRPMGAAEIREILGYPGKLPPHGLDGMLQGRKIKLLSQRAACQVSPYANKPHRVYVECETCKRLFPMGRLAQHESAHNRER